MAHLQYLPRPEAVELDLPAVTAGEAIALICARLAYAPEVLNFTAFRAAVQAGEEANPTVVDFGVAFPHARTNQVSDIVMAVGRSTAGISFGEDTEPVHLIFVIGTPRDMAHEYLAVLSRLAGLLRDPWVREGLLRAQTAEEFVAELRPHYAL